VPIRKTAGLSFHVFWVFEETERQERHKDQPLQLDSCITSGQLTSSADTSEWTESGNGQLSVLSIFPLVNSWSGIYLSACATDHVCYSTRRWAAKWRSSLQAMARHMSASSSGSAQKVEIQQNCPKNQYPRYPNVVYDSASRWQHLLVLVLLLLLVVAIGVVNHHRWGWCYWWPSVLASLVVVAAAPSLIHPPLHHHHTIHHRRHHRCLRCLRYCCHWCCCS